MGSRQKVLWSVERDQIIKDNRGKISASLIADLIGGGCTRCAVIGRARRLGLLALTKNDPSQTIRRKSYVTRDSRRSYQTVLRVKNPKIQDVAPVIDALIPFEQRKTLLELGPCDCRWPIGEPGTPDFFFCGAPKLGERSYCAAHCRRSVSNEPRPARKQFVWRSAA